MASTYTASLGIEKPGSGEQAGSWGDTVNTDLDQLDQAISGYASVVLTGAGSTGSPNEIKVTNTAAREELSDGRNMYIEITDGGDLGGNVYVQFTPDTIKKLGYIKNNLSGSRDLYVFQGTYNASRDFVIAAGDTYLLRFSGAGASSSTVTSVVTATETVTSSLKLAGELVHALNNSVAIDVGSYNRHHVAFNGSITLTFSNVPSADDADLGVTYHKEGQIVLWNGATPGTITISGLGSYRSVGSYTTAASVTQVLTYIIQRISGTNYTTVIWSN